MDPNQQNQNPDFSNPQAPTPAPGAGMSAAPSPDVNAMPSAMTPQPQPQPAPATPDQPPAYDPATGLPYQQPAAGGQVVMPGQPQSAAQQPSPMDMYNGQQPGQPQVMPTVPSDGQQPFVASQPNWQQPSGPAWKKFIKPAIIVLIVLVVAVGGYFGYKAISGKVTKTTTSNATNKVANSTKTSNPEINTLKSTFTLVAPDASKTQGMTSEQLGGATKLTSADGTCSLIYGIETQTQLPGTNIGDVISQYLAKLKTSAPGLKVTGPDSAQALVLKASNGKSYSVPTVSFMYTDTQQAGAAAAVYSVSELSNQSHVVVASICGSNTAKDPMSLMPQVNALEAAAATIQVKVQ